MLPHPREVVRQFTPHWFGATMGTGILSLALVQLPVTLPGVHALALALWGLNIGLFVLFSVLYLARWLSYPREAFRIFGHSQASMFLGTVPMGLATLINGLLIFGVPHWGQTAVNVAEGLWWVDAVMALACGVGIPYLMFTRQAHRLDQMTAVWLLPVVAAEVTAASGGLLVPHLLDVQAQGALILASYILWAYSVPVALSILVILLLRMALHKLPPDSMAASSWLALGPIGTGALGMLVIGGDALAVFTAQGMPALGMTVEGIGALAGVLLWGFGIWWGLMAVLITVRYWRRGIAFNLGWWGYTFPLGVYALATLKLGSVWQSPVLTAMGSGLVLALSVMWGLVMLKTVAGAWRGNLFVSPCLQEEEHVQERRPD